MVNAAVKNKPSLDTDARERSQKRLFQAETLCYYTSTCTMEVVVYYASASQTKANGETQLQELYGGYVLSLILDIDWRLMHDSLHYLLIAQLLFAGFLD